MRVRVPEPACVRLPEPEMAFEKPTLSLRLKTSVALLVTPEVESIEPVAAPLPIWRVPALILVEPV